MTFLYRLANRIARLKTPALAATTVALACSQGERTDFLSPVPNRPSSNLQQVVIEPKIAAIQAGAEFGFTASAINSSGARVAATFDWSTESGTISSDGHYVGLVPGPFRVIVRSHDRPELADTAVIAVWLNETDPTGISIQPATISLETGDTLTFSAFLNLANGVQAAGATVDWNTSGGTVNPSGLYTAPTAPGEYLVSASTSNGYTGTAAVRVRGRSAFAVTVAISPDSANISPNQGVQFSATTIYTDGKSSPGLYQWSTSLGSVTQSGAFAAGGSPGTAEVKVNLVGTSLTDSATVSIQAQAPDLVSLRVAPKPMTIQAGGVQQFAVSGTWSNGSTVVPTVTWSATGGSISSTGLYSAGSLAGTYRVIAVQQGGTLADTSVVTVQPPIVVALGIGPRYASLVPGASQQFTASATWSNGSTVLPALTWSATGGAISNNGLFTAGSTTGTYRVAVSGGGKTDTATVTIGAPRTLVSLSLSPKSGQIVTGGTLQFSPAALWSDGSTGGLPSLSWSATGGTVNSYGSYTAGSNTGTYRVIVNGGGKADTASVTVITSGAAPVPALVLTVSPKTISLPAGESQYFGVSALWPDGSTAVPNLTWSTSAGSVSSFLSGGYYNPPTKAGNYRVIVSANGAADTATVTVTGGSGGPATLTGLTLTPSAASVGPGASQMFTVAATWSDGSHTLPAISWSATGGAVTQNGLYTAGTNPGTFRVVASGGGKADTAVVSVGAAATVTQFNISPRNVTLALGQTQQFTTSAVWSDGVSRPVSVTYTATGGLISVGGLFTAGQLVGTFSVIASCTCGRADTSSVRLALVSPTLTNLTITPGSTSLQPGQTQQFTAAASWSDGSTTLPSLSWNASAGSISPNGLYSAPQSAGNYQVQLSGGGTTTTASVSVSAPSPVGPSDLYFNSNEVGCDGSNPNVLLCDDFHRGYWYNLDGDHTDSHAVAPGWGGTIYHPILPAPPNGAARNLGTPPLFSSSPWVATHYLKSNFIGGSTMAMHNLREVVTEVYIRFYTKPSSGYLFSGEKVLSVNQLNQDGGIWWAGLGMNIGQQSVSSDGVLAVAPGSGAAAAAGTSQQTMNQNQGNNIALVGGHWYYIELRIKLNSDYSTTDGIFQMWVNDGGANGDFSGQSPILRASHTTVDWGKRAGGATGIGQLWWENWANNGDGQGSSGERYLANIRVQKTGLIGFAH